MKYFITIILLSLLIFVGCANDNSLFNEKNNYSENEISLDIEHVNRDSMENFLNQYKEKFLPTNIDWSNWKNEDLIWKKYSFRTEQSNVSLFLIFTKTQQDALTLGEENFPLQNDNLLWGVNGAVLFVSQGEDKWEVSSVISHFTGEE